jgi:hypothetical protein
MPIAQRAYCSVRLSELSEILDYLSINMQILLSEIKCRTQQHLRVLRVSFHLQGVDEEVHQPGLELGECERGLVLALGRRQLLDGQVLRHTNQ